jgi:TetR/AcrR family transcriptional repressor of nem operon
LADSSLKPLVRLRRYFEAMIALAPFPGAPGCLLGNFGAELSNQSPAIRERVSTAFGDWTRSLAEVVEEAQNAGDLKTDISAQAMASFLINAWEGAVLRAKVEQSDGPLKAFLTMTFSRILT